jgi:protein-tyrosine phosphatase
MDAQAAIAELNQITDKVYLGGLRTAKRQDALKAAGIVDVLRLCKEKKEFPEITYQEIRMPDLPDFDLMTVLPDCIRAINKSAFHGRPILVHCMGGYSRSPSIIIAYLIWKGMSFEDALALVKSKRSLINPNDGFLQQLRERQQEIREIKVSIFDLVKHEHQDN